MNALPPEAPLRSQGLPPGRLARLDPALTWWRERTPRERRLLVTATVFITLTLCWTVGIRPALSSISASQLRLVQLQDEAARIQALVLEASALQRKHARPVDAAAMPDALRASLQRSGLGDSTQVETPQTPGQSLAPQWAVEVLDASAQALMTWLASVPRQFHARVQNVTLSRSRIDGRDRPGHVSGRIIIQSMTERSP